jgi:hypothetical protein
VWSYSADFSNAKAGGRPRLLIRSGTTSGVSDTAYEGKREGQRLRMENDVEKEVQR